MRGILAFFFCTTFFSITNAQNLDTAGVNILLIKCEEKFNAKDYMNAIPILDTALIHSKKLEFKLGIGNTLLLRGKVNQKLGHWAFANIDYQKSILVWEDLGDSFKQAEVYLQLTRLYYGLKEYDKGLKYSNEAKSIYKDFERKNLLGIAYKLEGMLYNSKQLFEQASTSYLEALSLFEETSNTLEQANVYYDLGGMYYQNDTIPIQLVKENLDISRELLKSHKDTLLEGKLYNVLGLTYYELDSISLAIESLEKSIEKAKLAGDTSTIYTATINLCKIYRAEKDYELFGVHLAEAESYLKDAKWAMKLDYESYNELSTDYLKYEKEKNKNYLRTRTALISVIGLLLGFLFYNGYRSRKTRQMQIKIMQENIDSFNYNYLEAKVDGERSERKKIGQNLHDTVGSQIAAVRWLYEENLKKFKDQTLKSEDLDEVYKLINQAYFDLRVVVKQLEEDDNDLLEKIGSFCGMLNTKNDLTIHFENYGMDKALDQNVQSQVCKIVMALMSNVLTHAKASKLLLQINQLEDEITIILEDNGIGFDTKKINWGSGLKNVEARIKELNGDWEMKSNKTEGTQIAISIPLKS